MKILLLLLTTLSITFIGLSQTSNTVKWEVIDEEMYSVSYPSNWTLTGSDFGLSFIVLSHTTSDNDPFRENVNLLTQDLTGRNIDMDKYVEISENQVTTMMDEGTLLESKRLYSKKDEFHKVVYIGKQNGFSLKFMQYYFIKNDKAYILTLTCEESEYENYVVIGEKILNSFVLK